MGMILTLNDLKTISDRKFIEDCRCNAQCPDGCTNTEGDQFRDTTPAERLASKASHHISA